METLRQLAKENPTVITNEREFIDFSDIKPGGFTDWQSFFAYYDQHYKPILEELKKEWQSEEGAKRFLAYDLLKLFG